jgi:hypothetical protein
MGAGAVSQCRSRGETFIMHEGGVIFPIAGLLGQGGLAENETWLLKPPPLRRYLPPSTGSIGHALQLPHTYSKEEFCHNAEICLDDLAPDHENIVSHNKSKVSYC